MSLSLLARAAGLAKGLVFGAKGVKGAQAAQAAARGLKYRQMAGNALMDYMGNDPNMNMLTKVGVNFGPDIFFGGVQGAMTPGDLGDKLIAGVSTGVGGALGGVGAVSALGKYKNNQGLRMMAEFGGGYGGDMLGQMGGDIALRAKGGGTTPWEKLQQSSDQEYRAMVEREMLAQYGVGGYNTLDPFLSENGLA